MSRRPGFLDSASSQQCQHRWTATPMLVPGLLALQVCGAGTSGSGANHRQRALEQTAGEGCRHVKSLDGAPSTTTKRPKPASSQTAADWRGGLRTGETVRTENRQQANNAGISWPGQPADACVVGRWAPLMRPHLARSDGPARVVEPMAAPLSASRGRFEPNWHPQFDNLADCGHPRLGTAAVW